MGVRLATVAALATLAMGCAEMAPPLSRARDSAGIRIVDNDGPAGPALVLDSAPAFDIGPAGGPGAEFISSPVSAVRLSDGRWFSVALDGAPRRTGKHPSDGPEPEHSLPRTGFRRWVGFPIQFYGAALASAPGQPQLEVRQSIVQPGPRVPSTRQPDRSMRVLPRNVLIDQSGW